MVKRSLWMLGLLLLALGACSSGSIPSDTQGDALSLSTNGVDASLDLQSDWGAGYCANVTLHNTSSAAVSAWTAIIDLGQTTMSQLWSGNVVQSGTKITVTPMSWNSAISPGASVAFGFCASRASGSDRPMLVSLTVQGGASAPDFALSASPASVTVSRASNATSTVALARTGGFAESIALTANGLPSGVSATFDPASTTGASSVLHLAASADAELGVANVVVTASGGGLTRTATLALTVAPAQSPSTRVENPFDGASYYVNSDWAAQVLAEVAHAPTSQSAAIAHIATQPTAIWLDRIAAIDGSATQLSLAGHLDAALVQQARVGPDAAMVVALVIYDLPDRDCAAFASNGELHTSDNGLQRYKTEYIDHIVSVIRSKPSYQQLRIVAIIEPDSLPNIVTNTGLYATCAAAEQTYRAGIAYAISQLAALDNLYLYLDIAHSAWLGWDHQDRAATVYNEVLTAAGGANLVRGFATNVANYSALQEPFNPYDNQNQYMDLIVNFYEWNRMIDETTYVNAMRSRFPNHHFIVDTGRNGWKSQAAGVPIEARTHRGNWCNIRGAGIGELPRANPMDGVDAYFWIKPPGESDGTSDPTATTPDAEGKRYDPMCGSAPVERPYAPGKLIPTDALDSAPAAGHWFENEFLMLVQNATPAL